MRRQTSGLVAGPETRASDAERERAAEALQKHHADGRLSTDELEERTGRAYAAKTLGDLDGLFADLPRRSPAGDEGPTRFRLWLPPFALPLIALLFAIAVLSSAHGLFFVWPLMFFLFFRFAFMRRVWWGRPRGFGAP